MLGIRSLGRDAAGYYLADPGRELPVAVPARWVGSGAAALGLRGRPGPQALDRLLGGFDPVAGRALGTTRTRVAAYDLTFSAPKSASVLLALSGRAGAVHVLAAHTEAVAGALDYLERHAVTAVRREGPERRLLGTDGTIGAQFTHAVSRNGDPHLHSHVVVANLVHAEDGRWRACDRRGLDAHRVAAAAVYEAQLRAGISAAHGVHWEGAPGRSLEVAALAPHVLGEFSSRRADILWHRHQLGVRGAGTRVAWAVTRPPKAAGRAFDDLAAEWERRARAVGYADPGHPRRSGSGPGRLDEHRFAGEIARTPHGGAHRRDVVAAFAGGARDGVCASAVELLVDCWVPPGPHGVREVLHQRRSVVPGGHLVQALGPRPLDPGAHQLWLGAARAIESYRVRWGLGADRAALGPSGPGVLGAFPAARLAEHHRVQRLVETARARLGVRGPTAPELGLGR